MGITKTEQVLPTMLSPLGKACAKMDLTAVHDILLKTGYKDEEGAENEVSSMNNDTTFSNQYFGVCGEFGSSTNKAATTYVATVADVALEVYKRRTHGKLLSSRI